MGTNLGWCSLLPPLIAIILVLITKESVFSLLIGGIVGCLVYSNFNPVKTLEMLLDVMTTRMSENIYIILFLALLGILVVLITNSGGAMAYGEWVGKKIKNKKGAEISTVLLAIMFFIDDYFNCLTVGATMSPIAEKQHLPKEKLAYIIDSTAAPICIIAPISSWAAVVLSTLEGSGIKNSFGVFIRAIPYNFYSIFTIFMVWSIILLQKDFGPMAKFEIDSKKIKECNISQNNTECLKAKNGKSVDLIIPIIVLIISSVVSLLYNGGYFLSNISVIKALQCTDSQKSLTYGAVIALIVAFFIMVPSKRLKFKEYMSSISDGIKSMVPAYTILILAWTIGGICKRIGTGEYVKYLVETSSIPIWVLPMVIFLVAGFLAFSTGTAWGTFGILIPVVVGIAQGLDESKLILFVSATLAGSVCGSHSSPISDTCILSATGAKCLHINHVLSQMPYAITVAAICCLSYIIVSFTHSLILAYLIGIILLITILLSLSKIYAKPNGRY